MAVYQDNYTAMVIFAQTTTQFGVENPNTINPDGSGTPYNPSNPNTPNVDLSGAEEQQNKLSQVKKVVVGLGVIQALKTSANYVKNNYGDIMQDSNAQIEINETMNLINMGVSIGTGFAVGGVIGGLAAIGATGLNVGLQTASYQRMLHRNNIQSQVMMARTQYATINGGR